MITLSRLKNGIVKKEKKFCNHLKFDENYTVQSEGNQDKFICISRTTSYVTTSPGDSKIKIGKKRRKSTTKC